MRELVLECKVSPNKVSKKLEHEIEITKSKLQRANIRNKNLKQKTLR